jgi:hypothetical protein
MSVNIIGRDVVTWFDHLAAGRFAEARPLEARRSTAAAAAPTS